MANTLYPDIVVTKRYDSILSTKLDLQKFLTVDYDLAEASGMTKKISVKTVKGKVQDLAMGEGNTEYVEVSTAVTPYTVGTTQGRFMYHDEEAMSDDRVVEDGLTGVAELMVNDFTSKAIGEFAKATLKITNATWKFDDVVDALALMNVAAEDGLPRHSQDQDTLEAYVEFLFMFLKLFQLIRHSLLLKKQLLYSLRRILKEK